MGKFLTIYSIIFYYDVASNENVANKLGLANTALLDVNKDLLPYMNETCLTY